MPGSGLIYIALAVLAIALVIGAIVGRYKVASPSEAFVISGSGNRAAKTSSRVIMGGGGAFILPIVQHLYRISLEQRQISFSVESAVSDNNILVNLTGVASIKVGGDEASVRAAAQRFLGQQGRIDEYTKEVLEGSLRAIVGSMTVDTINRERTEFAARVSDAAVSDLAVQGLQVDTLQIKNVITEGGYIEDLGRPEAAKVKQEAEVAEAKARQVAAEQKATSEQAISEANLLLEVRQAEILEETSKAQAKAAAAGPITEAEQRQRILEQEKLAAQAQASVTEQQLESTVRKPADAEAYRLRTVAEATKLARVAEAEAEATGVRLRGDAEASAIAAKGNSEAEAIKARSDAYLNYPEAGILDIALEGMPAIVAEAARPIGSISNLTVVSTDGMNAVTRGATDVLTQTASVIKDVSGIDIGALLSGIGKGTTASGDNSVSGKADAKRAASKATPAAASVEDD